MKAHCFQEMFVAVWIYCLFDQKDSKKLLASAGSFYIFMLQ